MVVGKIAVCGVMILLGLQSQGNSQIVGAGRKKASPVWTVDSSSKASAEMTRRLCGSPGCRNQVVHFDRNAMEAFLRTTPKESKGEASSGLSVLSVPMPDGSFEEFALVESEILAPALAARYPDIHTYRGSSVSDPSAVLRLDISNAGVHAIVLKDNRTFMIDPDGTRKWETHIAYEPLGGKPVQCDYGELAKVQRPTNRAAAGQDLKLPIPLTQMRVYRTALMLTSTYVTEAGGTAAFAIAAATSQMNRVNALFERDLNVRLQLVDAVVYTNAATQPFPVEDEANSVKILEASQHILTQIIGVDKFDLGEGFTSAGGGGVAALGSVCDKDSKAAGSSLGVGLVTPIHWINLVAHEFGHQFGANHTFNARDVAGCKTTSYSPTTALEPGSGSTTMSYLGLCTSETSIQDLQPSEDLIFHSYSIKEILDFVNDGGKVSASCSVPAAGAKINTPPTVTVGASSFIIPARTAFYLDAQATDRDVEDAKNLTFSWEQLDLGAANPGNEDEGTRPLFRAYLPTETGRRYFPSLTWALAGVDKLPEFYEAKANSGGEGASESKRFRLGEVLPTTDRTMRFRVTVRDNRKADGVVAGTLGFGETTVRVVSAAGPFRVTSPKGGETWGIGSTQTVTWDVANTTEAPLSTATVRILISPDGGLSFNVLADSVPNTGSATVTLPAGLTLEKARIKVEAGNSVYFAFADGDLQIK